VLVTEDALSGSRRRIDDVTDYGGRLALVSTAPASLHRLLITAVHVRAADLRTELGLDRLDHRLKTRALALLQFTTHRHMPRPTSVQHVHVRARVRTWRFSDHTQHNL